MFRHLWLGAAASDSSWGPVGVRDREWARDPLCDMPRPHRRLLSGTFRSYQWRLIARTRPVGGQLVNVAIGPALPQLTLATRERQQSGIQSRGRVSLQ